jgi:probable HAF family extracellular repeat protein
MRDHVLGALSALATAIVLAGGITAQTGGASARQYTLTALPLKPTAISDSGLVIGTVEDGHAAVWSASKELVIIPEAKGFQLSEARGINRAGEVVGIQSTADRSEFFGFLFRSGKLVRLPGENTRAFGINDAGDIAGEAILPGKDLSTAVLWKGLKATDLGACCAATAKAINANGQVIGNAYDQEGKYHAFLWEPGHGMRGVGDESQPSASQPYTSAIAINAGGHVLVQDPGRTLTLYRGNVPIAVEVSKKYPVEAKSMNGRDEIVGAFGPFYDADSAFIWDEARGAQDLNDLVKGLKGWKLSVATGINDKGQIVGFGNHLGEEDSGFLLTPSQP